MANWQRKIILNPEWDKAQDGECSIQELSASVAKKLKALSPFDDEDLDCQLEELIYEFDGMAESVGTTREEFDGFMSELYDWGDTQISGKFFDAKKVCWIDTMTKVEEVS